VDSYSGIPDSEIDQEYLLDNLHGEQI